MKNEPYINSKTKKQKALKEHLPTEIIKHIFFLILAVQAYIRYDVGLIGTKRTLTFDKP